MSEVNSDGMADVINSLAEAIREMRVDRVPPPAAFARNTSGFTISSFFVAFEKYCLAIYKKDTDSWLQVLPSFLEDEAREMVKAFGSDVGYHTVKHRLVEEFSSRTTLASNDFADFFSATRHPGETLACFSIRLETMAEKVAHANSTSHDMMVKSKFLSALPPGMLAQLNIQLGHQENATLTQVVRLATILESQSSSWYSGGSSGPLPVSAITEAKKEIDTEKRRQPVACNHCGKLGHTETNCFVKRVVCHSCGTEGHMMRNCPRRNTNQGRSAGTINSVPKCGFCGAGQHVLAECEMFRQRCMSCVWCGSVQHESYKCSEKPSSSGNCKQPGW